MYSVISKVFFILAIATKCRCLQFSELREKHSPKRISYDEIRRIAALSDPKYIDEVLDNILIPRVVGTAGHLKVYNYIKSELKKYGFSVETDEFHDKTPLGNLTFRNLIGTLNPSAERYLVLACHYDSKYYKDITFLAATDSAVPCAMMLNLIKVLNTDLRRIKDNELSLKLIFLDGEEAFQRWGPKDSIYGARHLARKYHQKKSLSSTVNDLVSDLSRIDLFVLLDLIGAKNPNFYSYFEDTEKWFSLLATDEEHLRNLGLLNGSSTYFHKIRQFSYIEDDHIPFLQKGVPILHLITSPFPTFWHTAGDNRSIVDLPTIEDLNKILRLFVVQYLHIRDSSTESATLEKEL